MAIIITVNGSLTLDETSGVQTPTDGNDINVTYGGGVLGGLETAFLTYLGTLGLSDAQKQFAAEVDGASSSSTFIQVNPTAGEEIEDLFFSVNSISPDGLISGMTTLDGDLLYLHVDSSGNFATVTTSPDPGGDIVAAFYLKESADHLSAQVQMVTFEPILHPDETDPDDTLDFTDVLQISAGGKLSFDFDNLDSGSFLWAAVGSTTAGLLVTGDDLNVNDDSNSSKYGKLVTGGSDPSDTVNTSQGGVGTSATIGINSQHFTDSSQQGNAVDGPIGVFTLVTGFEHLLTDPQATGVNVQDINYFGYINAPGASIFLSQVEGGDADLKISLWEAGGGTTPEEGFGYIGDQDTDEELHDDTPVDVDTVTVTRNGVDYVFSGSGGTLNGIIVNITGNTFTVQNATTEDTIAWTADGDTFNRFKIQGLAGTDGFDIGRIDIDQGVTESEGLGSHLFVDDDGPVLTGSTASIKVVEDELPTGLTDSDGDDDVATFSYADLAAIVDFGTDEPGSISLNLDPAFDGTAVLDVDGNAMTSKGVAVVWNINGSTLEGVAGARVVFTLTHDTGADPDDPTDDSFIFDLEDQLDHPNASGDNGIETLNLTPAFVMLDADDDPADLNGPNNDLETITVDVENDVPILSGSPVSKQVEEDELSTSAPPPADLSNGIGDGDGFTDEVTYSNADLQTLVTVGADEPVKFTLDLDGSLNGTAVKDVDNNTMTSKGSAMSWNVNGSVIEAKAADGRVVFTVTQTAGTGTPNDPTDDVFTVDLRDQLDHPDASGDTDVETINLTPLFNAKDFDGDAVDLNGPLDDVESIQLVVENDVPNITAQILNSIVDGDVVGDSETKSLNGAIGADENDADDTTSDGTKTYTFDSFTTPTNAWPTLYGDLSDDGTTINYYESNAVGADLVYSIVLNQDGSGEYTFTVHKEFLNQPLEFDFTDLPSGQNLFGVIAANKADLDGAAILVISANADINNPGNGQMTNVSGTVNTSKGGGPVTIGDSNQMYDPGEGAFFVYLSNPDDASVAGVPGGLTQNTADDADTIGFEDTTEVQSASVEIVQVQGKSLATFNIKAYDIDMAFYGANGVDTDAEARSFAEDPIESDDAVNVTAVRVISSTGVLLESWADTDLDGNYELLTNNASVDVDFFETSPGSGIYYAQVSGVNAGYTIEFDTETVHDVALIEGVSGKYDIGGFNLLQGQDSPDQQFDFSVEINDYDGDSYGGDGTAVAEFSVGVDGTGVFDDGSVIFI